jgi:hypothetical protein
MSPATRETEWQEVLTLGDEYGEQDQAGRSTFSYRIRTGGNESAAVALYRREQRRRAAGLVLADETPPQALDGVPPSHHVTTAFSRRVPDAVLNVLHAPGTWSPERLQAAALSCACTACQRDWPTEDMWWQEHNIAMQRGARRRTARCGAPKKKTRL